MMQVQGATSRSKFSSQAVLYITYDGLTSALGQSQIIPYVIELTKLGYEYTILSFEKADEFSLGKDAIASILQENNIRWVPLMFTSKPPILSKYYDLVRMRLTSIRLHQKYKFKIIHCRSYIAGQMGLMLKKKFGCRFLFDMRGFWVDERVDGNLWDLSKPFYKILYKYYKGIEKKLLKGADHIITLTASGKKELIQTFTVPSEKITIIPCCVDTEFFNPQMISLKKAGLLRRELQFSEEDYVIVYVGKLGTWYMLEEMLDFYKEFKTIQPRAKFLILADYDPEKSKTLIKRKHGDLDGIVLRKAQRKEIPTYLSMANSAVFFMKPVYSRRGCSPIKLTELMSMGIPVICNGGVGDVDQILSDENLGSIIHSFDKAEYRSAVNRLQNRTFDPVYIRRKAINEFSVGCGVEKYIDVYAKLTNLSISKQ